MFVCINCTFVFKKKKLLCILSSPHCPWLQQKRDAVVASPYKTCQLYTLITRGKWHSNSSEQYVFQLCKKNNIQRHVACGTFQRNKKSVTAKEPKSRKIRPYYTQILNVLKNFKLLKIWITFFKSNNPLFILNFLYLIPIPHIVCSGSFVNNIYSPLPPVSIWCFVLWNAFLWNNISMIWNCIVFSFLLH